MEETEKMPQHFVIVRELCDYYMNERLKRQETYFNEFHDKWKFTMSFPVTYIAKLLVPFLKGEGWLIHQNELGDDFHTFYYSKVERPVHKNYRYSRWEQELFGRAREDANEAHSPPFKMCDGFEYLCFILTNILEIDVRYEDFDRNRNEIVLMFNSWNKKSY
jgi:hypothetical protein